MKRKLTAWCLGLLAVLAVSVFPAPARSASYTALQPGEFVQYHQAIPVNIVLIGYDRRDNGRKDAVVDKAALLNELPATYEPVVRVPWFYGFDRRDLGLHYMFEYNVIETDDSWEDRFFGWLGTQGSIGPPTIYQQCYSGTAPAEFEFCNQTKNRREIRQTRYIDAPPVERYLAQNTRSLLGANADRSYTVYFINWYSRSDFQDHVYQRSDLRDPDTGVDPGQFDSTKLIAWGGSNSRSWFFDLSAGPEWNTDNWVVDFPDLNGDGIEEYRMPPIWEYADDGYRQLSAISRDLGLITRYVAINLLFTASPLYDPLVTAPGNGGDKVVHTEIFQDDPDNSDVDVFDTGFVKARLAALQPYHSWQVNEQSNYPADAGAKRALRIISGLIEPTQQDCASYAPFDADGSYFGALFCYFDEHIAQYVPPYQPQDHVGEVFAFNTTDEVAASVPFIGYADDNWTNGRQTYMYEVNSPGLREQGWGLSFVTVHEYGHHIGTSHPHDGYDSEAAVDYGPDGQFYYVWAGDESDSVMGYMRLGFGFGRFEQDNMHRWEMAGYLNAANELLAAVEADPQAGTVTALLEQADARAAKAQAQFEQWRYLPSATNARISYELILQAAEQLGIPADAVPLRLAPTDRGLPIKQERWRLPPQ